MKRPLSIAYIGELWEGSTCLQRAKVLFERGYNVLPFDITPYLQPGSRIRRALQHRLLWGPDIIRLNNDLIHWAGTVEPFQVIWIDKGRWIYEGTYQALKQTTNALLIHYTPDPQFIVHKSRHLERVLPLLDICVTTKRYELDTYRNAGARNIIFTLQGIDDRFTNHVRPPSSAEQNGVVFIGHFESHYATLLKSAATITEELHIWGRRWPRYARTHQWAKRFVKGDGVWGADYMRALASARVGLGFLSKYCTDQFTTRSFEIPAAGAMLLAERTDEHLDLFENGREADFFDSMDEMKEKINFYLTHEQARLNIAKAGQRRCLLCYHWRLVLEPAITEMERMVS